MIPFTGRAETKPKQAGEREAGVLKTAGQNYSPGFVYDAYLTSIPQANYAVEASSRQLI